MTAPAKPRQDPAKFRRYRERMRARGLKEVRLWVPDLDAPGFRARLGADIARINAANDDAGLLDAALADLKAMIAAEEAETPS